MSLIEAECRLRPSLKSLIAACAAATLTSIAAAVPTLYVDDSAPAGGSGTSWTSPYRHLQTALAAAGPGSGVMEIRVGQGIYNPDQSAASPSGTGDRNATFQLISGVALRGGYAGYGAVNPNLRDFDAFETKLSGDLAGNDGPPGSFQGYEENSQHIVKGNGVQSTAELDGFTMIGGSGDGGGLICTSGSPRITNCRFTYNHGIGGGAVQVTGASSPRFLRCEFIGNVGGIGGAMNVQNGPNVSVVDCTFTNNHADGGGAIHASGGPEVSQPPVTFRISGCTFHGNSALGGGGALFVCLSIAHLANNVFTQNTSGFVAGGAAFCTQGSVVNCVFTRNEAQHGGGMDNLAQQLPIINSSFSSNLGSAGTFGSAVLKNSILWGNSPSQVESGNVTITFSDVQGGWPGTGNINANPLFVQPGSDNLRLSAGSPCINAGSTAALPADALDLDGDGITTEPIPFDLDGEDRVQERIVDMGAYEGAGDPLPPQAIAADLDPGESALLIPDGGPFNPLQSAMALLTSVSGPPHSQFVVTQLSADPHPAAGGYSELGLVLATTSTMSAGQFFMTVIIPIDTGILGGADPFGVDATFFDSTSGNWALAVTGNTQPSPGHPGPIGDRITLEGTGSDWGLNTQLGDYGVFWNPSQQRGFVWANVDHLGDYGLGALGPIDCLGDISPQQGDGVIDEHDLRALLAAWGAHGGPGDLNHDGAVDFLDIGQLIAAWGACPGGTGGVAAIHGAQPANWGPCPPGQRCAGDLDRNHVIDSKDLGILFANWGRCAGCEADLNRDGKVDRADLHHLMNSRR